MIQTSIDLFGPEPRAAFALSGYTDAAWGFPGDALSASFRLLYPPDGLSTIHFARWVVVWNPDGANGIRLVNADFGPADIRELAAFTGSSTTPVVAAVVITDALNELITAGAYRFLGHQLRGGGSRGPIVFLSSVEIVWAI